MQDRPYRVTIDVGAFVTVARPDIVVGLPERRPGRQRVLQVGSGRTIPVVKETQVGLGLATPVVREALRELTLGQRALNIWVLVIDITEEFILGLDNLRAYHATVDVERHGLRQARMRRQ
jgi:hypothetical protein